jgi:hypothetical protein
VSKRQLSARTTAKRVLPVLKNFMFCVREREKRVCLLLSGVVINAMIAQWPMWLVLE